MKIGVLALQGDFIEHIKMLEQLNVETVEVRLPEHLKGIDGLIIPGGESTTIGKLAVAYNLLKPLQQFGQRHAIWGTCAGAIFLSKDVSRDQPLLGLMDIKVARNAFGRQVDSFEADLDIPELKQATGSKTPYHAFFIVRRSSKPFMRIQRFLPLSRTGELSPRNKALYWLHPFTPN
jgi:5'-phosphate synthase pdxT subunit